MSALSDAGNLRLHDIADGDVRDDPRWLALMGENAVKAFLADMAAKHGTHNQLDHGRRVPHLPDLPGDADGPRKPSSRETVKAGDFSGLKRVGGRRGSNPAGVYEADDGSKWYVKEQKSLDHARNEALAASLYRETLYEGPQVFVGEGAPDMDGPQTASEWLDTDGPIDLNNERQISDVRFGFAVDAWLANWDVAGLSMDNVELQNGFPIRVDAGGALLYRAQGGEKGSAFGDKVTEWDTLRDPGKAPQASRLFAGMTRDEMIRSATKVQGVTRQRIRELVTEHDLPDSLADRLIARRADIIDKTEKLQLEAEAELGEDRIDGVLANRHALAAAPARLTDRDKGAADVEAELTFGEDPGWSKRTHDASERAVRFYRNSTYRQIGKYLREDGDSTMMIRESADDPGKQEDLGMHVALIDQVMENSRLKEPILVWRGIQDGEKVFGDKWSENMVGVEWDELSFPSTSADPAVGGIFEGLDGALMRWHVPEGVGAIRLDGWKSNARHTAEAELLLDRNLRARIVADRTEDRGHGLTRRIFDVEVVPIDDDDPALKAGPKPSRSKPGATPGIERMTMDYTVRALRRRERSVFGDITDDLPKSSRRDTQVKHRKHLTGQHNQQDHGGHGLDLDDALDGLTVYVGDEYFDDFGPEVYSETTSSGVAPRFFESGEAHLALDLNDGDHQVFAGLDNPDAMRDLASDIRALLRVDVSRADEDEDGIVDSFSGFSGIAAARYASGDLRLSSTDGGAEMDITEAEAGELAGALDSVAEMWDREDGTTKGKNHDTGDSAKTRRAMNTKTMQANGFRIKNADRGEFSAVLATLNVIDSDGDVTKPGAFDGSDFPLSAYGHKSWEGALPVGIGRVKETGNEIILEGQFFMDTTHGRDTFLTVKRLGPLGQWSYGYDPVKHSNGMHEGKSVRFLEKLKVHEASPVLVGAGVGTRTLGTKGRDMTASGRSRAVKGAIPSHETKTVSRAWDRVRTENALPDDARPSELRTVYAYVDPDGDPELKASYSWPHHHGIGGPANLRACLMGIAALNGPAGADMGEPERKGIYDHLAGHLKDADREPPALRDRGTGPTKQYDELSEGLAIISGLIDGAYSGAALRREKGRGLSGAKAELLTWMADDLTRLKSLLSNPVEPETPEPDDDEVASVFAASIARLHGITPA